METDANLRSHIYTSLASILFKAIIAPQSLNTGKHSDSRTSQAVVLIPVPPRLTGALNLKNKVSVLIYNFFKHILNKKI